MMDIVLDGKALAREIEQGLLQRVAVIKARDNGDVPVLATILVGDEPASATYVRLNGRAC